MADRLRESPSISQSSISLCSAPSTPTHTDTHTHNFHPPLQLLVRRPHPFAIIPLLSPFTPRRLPTGPLPPVDVLARGLQKEVGVALAARALVRGVGVVALPLYGRLNLAALAPLVEAGQPRNGQLPLTIQRRLFLKQLGSIPHLGKVRAVFALPCGGLVPGADLGIIVARPHTGDELERPFGAHPPPLAARFLLEPRPPTGCRRGREAVAGKVGVAAVKARSCRIDE
mmetsp:Transcript_33479/g.82924  ORF Transcript_33479/g.82924 Transcript_33479/m.82924 type:complete len:228 (-) Transcript_33479:620-1303(-)